MYDTLTGGPTYAITRRDQDIDDRILAAVRRLGCVQYDPLNVVGRNHDLVLQSRIPRRRP